MWAGTVVAPPWPTSAGMVSVSSRSRSVALKASLERSALTRTLARIGMVFRRSTTRWTWPSDFNRAARSTVTFMPTPLRELFQGGRKWRVGANFARVETRFCLISHGRPLAGPYRAQANGNDPAAQTHGGPGFPGPPLAAYWLEAYSCSCRFRVSISSASALSLPTRCSILRTACRTVVWSRPPNRRPISGSERSVRVLARYIATWRGRTTLAVRRDDNRSARLTLYWRATMR